MSDPSNTVGNGRDRRGRFTVGNRAAQGNPFARRVARLRASLLRAIEPHDIEEVVKALLEQAKAGDAVAAREVLNRALGKAEAVDVLQRLAAIEERLEAATAAGRAR